MALTKVNVWNMALAELSNTNLVTADTDTTTEAVTCALFWDTVVDEVSRAVKWPFLLKIVALAGKAATPNVDWAFSYTFPADCVTFRRVLDSITRLNSDRSLIPYRRTEDKIYTDVDNAVAEYSVRIAVPTNWPADFALCVSLRLAGWIAPAVAGAEGKAYRKDAWERYDGEIKRAAANASAEERDTPSEVSTLSGKEKEQICNRALSLLGVDVEIQVLATEKSREARAARQFYNDSRDQTLRDFDWPFARKRLALTGKTSAPVDEWGFSYALPADSLVLRRILNGSSLRTETDDTRVRFQELTDGTTPKVYTDQDDAIAVYTMKIDDPLLYPPDFKQAMAALMAHKMAAKVLGVELANKTRTPEKMLALYQYEITKAKVTAANEDIPEQDTDSELERARV